MIFESDNRENVFRLINVFFYKDVAKIILDYDDEFDHILNAITYKKWSNRYLQNMKTIKNTDIMIRYKRRSRSKKVDHICIFDGRKVITPFNTPSTIQDLKRNLDYIDISNKFEICHVEYYMNQTIYKYEHFFKYSSYLRHLLLNYLKYTHNQHINIDGNQVYRFMKKIYEDIYNYAV